MAGEDGQTNNIFSVLQGASTQQDVVDTQRDDFFFLTFRFIGTSEFVNLIVWHLAINYS